MKAKITLGTLSLGLVLLGACSSGLRENWTSEMGEALRTARAENDRHLRVCLEATSLPGVMEELGRHEQQMTASFQQLQQATGRMYRCSANGMTMISAEMFEMRSGIPAHRWQLEQTTSLDSAKNECSTHALHVESTLHDMESELATMSCSGSSSAP